MTYANSKKSLKDLGCLNRIESKSHDIMSALLFESELSTATATEADFHLKTIAATCRVSLDDLERQFQTVFQKTRAQWLREAKSHAVLKLLAEGHKLKDIATMLDFANSSHLSNEFRKVHSVSPRKLLTSLTRRAARG